MHWRWDIATLLTALGMAIGAIVYIVSLSHSVDELRRSKSDIAETAALQARVFSLEGDKDYSSLVAAKRKALQDFESAVRSAQEELSAAEAKKTQIMREIAKSQAEFDSNGKRVFAEIQAELSKLRAQEVERNEEIAALKREIGSLRSANTVTGSSGSSSGKCSTGRTELQEWRRAQQRSSGAQLFHTGNTLGYAIPLFTYLMP